MNFLKLVQILIIVCLLSNKIFTQNRIENGLKEGLWEMYDDTKKCRIKCYYVHDTLHGKYTKYRIYKEKKVFEANYNKGVIDGKFKYYWASGKLEKEGFCRNGVQHGLVQIFDLKGKLRSSLSYNNGVLDGLCISYYHSGKTRTQYWHRKGFRTDTTIWYHPKGKYVCLVIATGKNYSPKIFHLKNMKTNSICSWDVRDLLSDDLEEYQTMTINRKRFLSSERLWIGWAYIHEKTGKVTKVYFVSDCDKMKPAKAVGKRT